MRVNLIISNEPGKYRVHSVGRINLAVLLAKQIFSLRPCYEYMLTNVIQPQVYAPQYLQDEAIDITVL